jgi:hypothetical protein
VAAETQHSRDVLLLSKIIDYLGCGNLEKPSTRPDGAIFVVYKFSDICEKIIPKAGRLYVSATTPSFFLIK